MNAAEKLKRKIKVTKWMNKHFNKVILGIGIPATFLGQFGMVISPFFSLISMVVAFLTYTIGGGLLISRYQDTEYLTSLERELYYVEQANEETIELLDRNIANLQANPTSVKDEQTTKSLVKELIKIKKATQKALEESQKDNIKKQKVTVEHNNDTNIMEI